MNFYIGNSIGEIKFDDYNIEFSDDLLQYIYNQRKQILVDLNVLFEIDTYSDTFLECENVKTLNDICSLIIETDIIKGYDDYDEGIEMLDDLLQITNLAFKRSIMMKPKYCENIIVAVIHRKKFNWYITNKELWRMDYVKEYESWKECYVSMGRTEKQFMYDVGSLEEFCAKRWGIKVLDVKSADVFLSKIEKNKVSLTELKQMFKDANIEEKTVITQLCM